MATQLPIRSTGVSVVILRGSGSETQTLLMRRATAIFHGSWCQVAGGIEPGEAAWQTAVRELREETGLAPLAFYSAGYCEQFYDARIEAIDVCPVFVAMVADDAAVTLNSEHSEYRWVPIGEVDELLATPNQSEMFAHVRRHFVDRRPSERTRIDAGAP